MEIKEQKKALRRRIKQQFAALSEERLIEMSEDVLTQLKSDVLYRDAELVLAFVSMSDEIATDAILRDVLATGRRLAVPKVAGDDLVFYFIENLDRDLVPGAFGILEPVDGLTELDVKKLPEAKTVVLVPGLAFDRDNYRLGRGKGFYDRFFALCGEDVPKVGICLSFQMVESVPREPHDRKLDKVISSKMSV